ncbi:Uncharacterized protein dnm_023100 [Desulfonema magnum]|uniref:Uncharacterized protein n=1 Tax=Desulfonema magnum TaxID=45655 RepID=A0A975BJH1_9BACT|nr:Uncharacterized protein dnm_023100 [Desulfonema magnum]
MFISIRNWTKKKFGEIYQEVVTGLWECYGAVSRTYFSQRVRCFTEWAEKISLLSVIADKIVRIRKNINAFSIR